MFNINPLITKEHKKVIFIHYFEIFFFNNFFFLQFCFRSSTSRIPDALVKAYLQVGKGDFFAYFTKLTNPSNLSNSNKLSSQIKLSNVSQSLLTSGKR
jgi:hypothetical protein